MYAHVHARCNAGAYSAIDNKQTSSPTQPAAVAANNADGSPIVNVRQDVAQGEQQSRVINACNQAGVGLSFVCSTQPLLSFLPRLKSPHVHLLHDPHKSPTAKPHDLLVDL
jgi:hypothetical protein